jgi:hypothetical protein
MSPLHERPQESPPLDDMLAGKGAKAEKISTPGVPFEGQGALSADQVHRATLTVLAFSTAHVLTCDVQLSNAVARMIR